MSSTPSLSTIRSACNAVGLTEFSELVAVRKLVVDCHRSLEYALWATITQGGTTPDAHLFTLPSNA